MVVSGQSWQRTFKGLPEQGAAVRLWVRARVDHVDAALVTHELFIAVLATSPAAIDLTLSTAGPRVRISATGPAELPLRHAYGPGHAIISGLSTLCGIASDARGLWALLTKE